MAVKVDKLAKFVGNGLRSALLPDRHQDEGGARGWKAIGRDSR
jgi:hypothetical protein